MGADNDDASLDSPTCRLQIYDMVHEVLSTQSSPTLTKLLVERIS